MFKAFFLTIFCICCCIATDAQTLYSISGVVKDKRGETLPGAGIYLSGYTIATVTNNDGQFVLSKLKPGSYEVVVQMIGYLPYSKSVVISDRAMNISIVLSENTIQLNEVVIQADLTEKNICRYLRSFLLEGHRILRNARS